MTMSQALLPEFDNEMKLTRKALERVPDDKFDWKPHAKSMTLGRLAGHLAELPGFGTAIIATDGINFDKGEYKADGGEQSRRSCWKCSTRTSRRTREAIAGATDDHLRQPWHLIYQEKKIFEAPRAAALRAMAHEPYRPSSRPIDGLPAVERRRGSFDLRPVRGRDVIRQPIQSALPNIFRYRRRQLLRRFSSRQRLPSFRTTIPAAPPFPSDAPSRRAESNTRGRDARRR